MTMEKPDTLYKMENRPMGYAETCFPTACFLSPLSILTIEGQDHTVCN